MSTAPPTWNFRFGATIGTRSRCISGSPKPTTSIASMSSKLSLSVAWIDRLLTRLRTETAVGARARIAATVSGPAPPSNVSVTSTRVTYGLNRSNAENKPGATLYVTPVATATSGIGNSQSITSPSESTIGTSVAWGMNNVSGLSTTNTTPDEYVNRTVVGMNTS